MWGQLQVLGVQGSSEVHREDHRVWESSNITTTEKPTEFVVEGTYLAGYSEKLDSLTLFFSSSLICEPNHIQQLLFYIFVNSGSTYCFANVSFVHTYNVVATTRHKVQ